MKHDSTFVYRNGDTVAPRVGAWIETTSTGCCMAGERWSLPVWERGLKHLRVKQYFWLQASLPVWERGLKQAAPGPVPGLPSVAPRVGAWIETVDRTTSPTLYNVAPRVGAWIETRDILHQQNMLRSLPVWERGLKLLDGDISRAV